jgi:hypothetical protein
MYFGISSLGIFINLYMLGVLYMLPFLIPFFLSYKLMK